MTGASPSRAVAQTVSAMMDDGSYDIGDVLALLVAHCATTYPAEAVAVLVTDGSEGLEMLSATSHRAEELDLLQVQHRTGPCVEAIETGRPVRVIGADRLRERWGSVGAAIDAKGFIGVHAYPMLWRGRARGGLNLFLSAEPSDEAEALDVGQLFADLATRVLVHTTQVAEDRVTARIHEAVTARAGVEQAKGVLAVELGIEAAAAFDVLVARAHDEGLPLSEAARRIVLSSAGRPRD